ncbi:nuclease-related domain-containing protein [Desulfosalsimonas sp.]|uniref:nuclease-related domain-containing protein n=1 Tax=Desulfosalsimonas sp. TaxID=3073848 RepID=UPI003970E6D8
MAYIEDKTEKQTGNPVSKHVFFVILSAAVLAGSMLFFAQDWKDELPTILFIVLVIAVLIVFVSRKANPLGWKKILNKNEFNAIKSFEKDVTRKLSQLDDAYFIFSNFSFELFNVDHLIVSKNGMFVVSRVHHTERLQILSNALFAGENSLEALTDRTWRLCHLINIIIRKGFKGLEIMPVPILVVPDTHAGAMTEFNGIAITTIEDLNDTIDGKLAFPIDREHAEGFAFYMKKMYM